MDFKLKNHTPEKEYLYDFSDYLIKWAQYIPRDLKLALLTSFVFGLIAHLFCYTNVLFAHDAAQIFWETDFVAAAGGSRWLIPFWNVIIENVQVPWLIGLITLFFYGISSWLICRVLNITRSVPVVMVTALVVTCPTATASNLYLSSAHIYSGALLFAVASVYVFKKWKYGWIASFFMLLITAGSYAAYVNVAVTLFLIDAVGTMLESPDISIKKLFPKHVCMAIISLAASVITIQISSAIAGNATQKRVSTAMSFLPQEYLLNILNAAKTSVHLFMPSGDISFLQHEKPVYFTFVLCSVAALLIALWIFIKNKIFKDILKTALIVVDLLFLPLAMNISGVFYTAHFLMLFTFITPWIWFIQLHEILARNRQRICGEKCLQHRLCIAYSAVVLLTLVVTIGHGCLLSNVSYIKAAANYEAATSLVNRFVDRIEAADEYIPGQTKVFFVGDIHENYAPHREQTHICFSLTGIGRGSWDTALTYHTPLEAFIQQHLGINMKFAGSWPTEMDDCIEFLKEDGVSLTPEQESQLKNLPGFPRKDNYLLIDDYLIFNIGNGSI